MLFFVGADIIRPFFVYDLICCRAGLVPSTKLTERKMYIENRCRPRAATVKIRKHYLPVGHLSPLEGTAFAGANRRGEGVSLAVLPPFLCAVKEMGWYRGKQSLRLLRRQPTLAVPKIFCGIRLEYFDRGAKPCSLFRPLGALRKLCSVSFGYKRNGVVFIKKQSLSHAPVLKCVTAWRPFCRLRRHFP